MRTLRAAILVLAVMPFCFYAARDLAYHLKSRKPGIAENLVHLLLGVLQATLIASGIGGNAAALVFTSVGVAGAGAVDEYAFHHELPAREADLHAKAHFALFIFVAVALALAMFPDVASVRRLVAGS